MPALLFSPKTPGFVFLRGEQRPAQGADAAGADLAFEPA
jgi:hypothetical protein